MAKKEVVYISYDGMTDSLGQSQVIPYVVGLAKEDYHFTLMSFEKKERYGENKERISELLTNNSIRWKPFRYHSGFSLVSTAYDLLIGFFFLLFYIPRHKVKIIHCRSYVSAVLGYVFKKIYGTKFIFDMRGFWGDERYPDGRKNPVLMYRVIKSLEKKFIKSSDAVVCLTRAGIKEMSSWEYVEERDKNKMYHITTCCDIDKYFSAYEYRSKKTVDPESLRLTYVGSFGALHAKKEMLDFISVIGNRFPKFTFDLILNSFDDQVLEEIRHKGIDMSRISVRSLPHYQIPQAYRDADIGFFFIPIAYAKLSSSPTKMGEMLAAGLPIITGPYIGDVDELIHDNQLGDIVYEFNDKAYLKSVIKTIELIKNDKQALMQRALATANSYFSLENGSRKFSQLYKELYR